MTEPGATPVWIYIGRKTVGSQVWVIPAVSITDPDGLTFFEPVGSAQLVTVTE